MNRFLIQASTLAVATTVVLACSSNVPVGADTHDTGTIPHDEAGIPDTGAVDACTTLFASEYSNTCTSDSDCVAVLPQYFTCSPCGPISPSGPDACHTAALPTASAAKYADAINSSFAAFPGKSDSTCPVEGPCANPGTPQCVHGACALGGNLSDGGDAGDSGHSCKTIVASSYDLSCNSDSDCTAVVEGGDTCDPCSAPDAFTCASSAVSKGAAASYNQALTAALPAAPGTQFAFKECGMAVSCPVGGAACVNHVCKGSQLPDGGL